MHVEKNFTWHANILEFLKSEQIFQKVQF